MGNFTLQDAIDLATFAHRKQFDKAGEPYINHPLRVLESVKAQGAQAYVQMAAVLHDVTEDTPFTTSMLLAFDVPEAAVQIVRLVDRNLNVPPAWQELMTDQEWSSIGNAVSNPNFSRESEAIRKRVSDEYYYREIGKHPGALIVKKADIGDNLQPWRLEYLPPETQERLRKKYAKALDLLT